MMGSLYSRILLASFAMLVVSLLSFLVIFFVVTRPAGNRGIRGFVIAEADTAAAAFDAGGREALRSYLAVLDRNLEATHHLVDAKGIDRLSGEDRGSMLRLAQERGFPPATANGKAVITAPSTDGRYRLIALLPPPPIRLLDLVPYYGLVLATVAGLCWWLAAGIASPIRRLAVVVNSFGRGNLAARAESVRRDELGDLARAYNGMAERIVTLIHSERQLLQDVSHELRTPLTRLNVAIELSRTAVDRDAFADQLQAEADRLTTLVTSLLETTRTEGNIAEPEQDDVDASGLLRALVTQLTTEAASRGIAIALQTGDNTRAQGNPELLRRAFENVLRNALRHAPVDSTVEVECTRRNGHVVVTIRDFGPGVPDDTLARLGTPFFRSDPSRAAETGGLGLGLAIARRAVHLHGGNLSFENARPGLRVLISIPAPANVGL